MLREYELMYVVRPDLDEEGLRGAVEAVQVLVEAQGAEVTTTTPWGKRRLAYEIAGLRDGHYVIVEFRGDGAKVKELERALRISDHVIRHMITIAVPKPPEGEGKKGPRATDAEGEDGDIEGIPGEDDEIDGLGLAVGAEDEMGEDL